MIDPVALRAHYCRFVDRDDRTLLTGHSHQAWPDVAREGLVEAFDDAARHVDDKWAAAFEAADAVREAVASRLSFPEGALPAEEIALGANTHELLTRFLSALDLRRRPHLVTTSGEFHSLRRQVSRLAEEGVEVTFVAPRPVATLTARLADAVRKDTAAVMTSTVLFETSEVVPDLAPLTHVARARGAEVLLDAYHAFNVVPFTLEGLDPSVFVTGGGYKYAQWGEGCCFLRVPPRDDLRPVFTGWFSDFGSLESPGGTVRYGTRPCDRFAGSTYDPSSHYRARRVIEFFDLHDLSVARLRALSLRQTEHLMANLEGLPIETPREDAHRGGFVSVRLERAKEVAATLRGRGVYVDARRDLLRIGPAPYTTDEELTRGADALRALLR